MTDRPPFPFIVGCARSGTTLLRLMLQGHPALAIPPESYFPVRMWPGRARYLREDGFDMGRFVDDLLHHPRLPRPARTVRDKWDLDPLLLQERLQGVMPIDYPEAIRRIFALYAETKGKPRYGDKTPVFVLRIPLLAELFPEAVFVHIVRDGRDVAMSLVERHWGPETLEEGAAYWAIRVREGRTSGRVLGPDRYREVRYEDLLAWPEGVLRELSPFVGLDFRQEMLSYEDHALDNVPPDERFFHEHLSEPPTAGLRDWRRALNSEDLETFEAIAGAELSDFGYERARPDVPPRPAPPPTLGEDDGPPSAGRVSARTGITGLLRRMRGRGRA